MNSSWFRVISGLACLLFFTNVYAQSAILDTFSTKLNISRSIIDKFISDVPKIDRTSQFPTKIVVEDITIDNKKDTTKSVSSEMTLSPIEGGIMSIIKIGKNPDGTGVGAQTISYLGIVNLGEYSYDHFEQRIGAAPGVLGLIPLFQIKKNVDLTLLISLVAFDGNLENIANPESNNKWSFTSKVKTIYKKFKFDQKVSTDCIVSDKIEASTLHPKLSGRAIIVISSVKLEGNPGFTKTYAFLENYKWYFLIQSAANDGKWREFHKIVSVE